MVLYKWLKNIVFAILLIEYLMLKEIAVFVANLLSELKLEKLGIENRKLKLKKVIKYIIVRK